IAYRDKNAIPQINKSMPKSFPKDSEIFFSPPDFALAKYGIDKNLYLLESRNIYPVYPVIGMFGCPFRCSFCATPLHFPEPSKPISPGNFVDHIEIAVTKHHISRFSFWDDTLTRNTQWIKGICSMILDRQLKIQWWCFGKVDWVLKNRDILPLMRQAGCTMIWLGVESTDDNDLALYNKKINFPMAEDAVDCLAAEDILPTTSFILGNINDDENKTRKIIDISGELTAKGAINIYTLLVPIPGTELFEMLGNRQLNVKKDLRLFNGTRALLDYPGMTGERLEEIFFAAYQNSVLNDRFLKNTGRTNFELEQSEKYDKTALLQGFVNEKMRMLTLEKTGYLDDDPLQMAISCQWVFEQRNK
ncbi:MAG: radical SAM protein, partial [Acidobacteria bacterium]|nr:radical SAM protein [Acidobacteriota bacterium]